MMSAYGETTAAAATEAAGVRAVAFALLVTVTFSCVFFYMMRWAASSSERQQRSSRHQRGNVGDDFIATAKHKKSVTAAVHQRKKNNGGNKHHVVNVRPSSANAAYNTGNSSPANNGSGSANSRNGDKKKKKAAVAEDVFTADTVSTGKYHNAKITSNDLTIQAVVSITGSDVTTTDPSNGIGGEWNRRTRRRKQQQEQSRTGVEISTHIRDYNTTATVTSTKKKNDEQRHPSSHSRSSDDHIVGINDPFADDDDQDQGEWITMVTYTITKTYLNGICIMHTYTKKDIAHNNTPNYKHNNNNNLTRSSYFSQRLNITVYVHCKKLLLSTSNFRKICIYQKLCSTMMII